MVSSLTSSRTVMELHRWPCEHRWQARTDHPQHPVAQNLGIAEHGCAPRPGDADNDAEVSERARYAEASAKVEAIENELENAMEPAVGAAGASALADLSAGRERAGRVGRRGRRRAC